MQNLNLNTANQKSNVDRDLQAFEECVPRMNSSAVDFNKLDASLTGRENYEILSAKGGPSDEEVEDADDDEENTDDDEENTDDVDEADETDLDIERKQR